MLSDVDRGTAIFAAKRNALENAKNDQQYRARGSRLRIGWNEADQESRSAHQRDGDKESAFAAEAVADDAEYQRSERAKGKSGGEQAKGRDPVRALAPGRRRMSSR